MIYVTGDCHGEFSKLSNRNFPECAQMTKDDFVIICGDFGAIWNWRGETPEERFWLNWLEERPFTTLFADGNHENYDRLSAYETVDFMGGRAGKINSSVYRLLRGEIYTLGSKSFFVMGGALSHDVEDGVYDRADFRDDRHFSEFCRRMNRRKKRYRVRNRNVWDMEMPSEAEYENAGRHLAEADYKVDYVITHCAPQRITDRLKVILPQRNPKVKINGKFDQNELTLYLDSLCDKLSFKRWFFGHFHDDYDIDDKFSLMEKRVERIV